MSQRGYETGCGASVLGPLLESARADVVQVATAKGGWDAIIVHTEESPGFLWVER